MLISNSTAPASATAIRHTLDRRRVYVFPTRHGFLFGAMILVIVLGSINYDNALGYLLSFLLFGLFLISILHTYRNLTALSFVGAEAAPVFAGSDAHFKLVLDNRDRWSRYRLDLAYWPRTRGWRRRRGALPPSSTIEYIGPDDIAQGIVTVAADTRGWLALSRVRISSVFPLGIVRAWAYFENAGRCIVYPRPKGKLPLPAPRYEVAKYVAQGAPDLGNDDFAGFRRYRGGDPIRAINWKALARENDVLVKRFSGTGDGQIWLRWDDCAILGNIEDRLSQLCEWIIRAESAQLVYGLELPHERIAPGFGPLHRHRCLERLALYPQG